MRTVTMLATGPQALVQDLGRPGIAHLGVPPSGALDVPALRLANRLVGNAESAAGVEALLGGLRLRADCSCVVAVTGPAVQVTVNGGSRDSHTPSTCPTGTCWPSARPPTGCVTTSASTAGLAVPAELGSRSTDLLSGIGPAPMTAGDTLPLGDPTGQARGADQLGPRPVPDEIAVPVLLGPRDDWFDRAAEQLTAGSWRVSPESNRIGLRLTGPALVRAAEFDSAELPERTRRHRCRAGAGERATVMFLADHPTTGGYPVIGVLPAAALALVAQARPGTSVRFRPVQYSDS